MERAIRVLMKLLEEPAVLENDRLREAISIVIQEIVRRQVMLRTYPKEEEECPCGCSTLDEESRRSFGQSSV